MSNLGFRVYPSGFAVRDPKLTDTKLVGADKEVTDLFNLHLKGEGRQDNFEYFMRVIRAATRLLGKDPNWLLTQIHNANITKAQAEFVTDTIILLKNGRRTKLCTTWRAICCGKSIVTVKRIQPNGFSVNKEIVVPKDILFGTASGIISAWLSVQDGFADLVEALYLMFGDHDTEVV